MAHGYFNGPMFKPIWCVSVWIHSETWRNRVFVVRKWAAAARICQEHQPVLCLSQLGRLWEFYTLSCATPRNGNDWNLIWLVVWNMNSMFPYIGNNHPNWRTHIVQRGGSTTNQFCSKRPLFSHGFPLPMTLWYPASDPWAGPVMFAALCKENFRKFLHSDSSAIGGSWWIHLGGVDGGTSSRTFIKFYNKWML